MKDDRSYWLDRSENVTMLYRGLWLIGVALVALDLFVSRHESIDAASVTGFYAGYGFFACVILVLVAKQLRRVLMRPEDYYER